MTFAVGLELVSLATVENSHEHIDPAQQMSHTPQCGAQFLARIAAIGEDMSQPRMEKADRGQHGRKLGDLLDAFSPTE